MRPAGPRIRSRVGWLAALCGVNATEKSGRRDSNSRPLGPKPRSADRANHSDFEDDKRSLRTLQSVAFVPTAAQAFRSDCGNTSPLPRHQLAVSPQTSEGSEPSWPAPLALESTWLRCVRPACDGGTPSSRRRQAPRAPWHTSMARARQPDLRDENRRRRTRPTPRFLG